MLITMKGMMRKQQAYCVANTRSLYLQKHSQIITKLKPKIRIIHIFPPEIIKTGVANFRDLVQRLTEKPVVTHDNKKRMIKATRAKLDEPSRFSEFREKINKEIEVWDGGNFLGDFADLDGFMQELNHFQMLPVDANNSYLSSIEGTQIVKQVEVRIEKEKKP